jgi:hypothetical protein
MNSGHGGTYCASRIQRRQERSATPSLAAGTSFFFLEE